MLWFKGLNFGETPRLYYWLTCVREKVEVPASSKLHLTIFHPSGQIAYARCRVICPYLSGQIAHRQTWAICPYRSEASCTYLSGQIAYKNMSYSVRIRTNSSPGYSTISGKIGPLKYAQLCKHFFNQLCKHFVSRT